MLISEDNLNEKNERPCVDKLITGCQFLEDGGIFQLPPVNSFSLFGFLKKRTITYAVFEKSVKRTLCALNSNWARTLYD